MSNASGVSGTVAAALSDVTEWRADAEQRHRSEISEVDLEIDGLRQAIANLEQQIEALTGFRSEVDRKYAQIDDGDGGRSYSAVFEAIQQQAAALAERAERVSQIELQRSIELAEAMKDSALAPLLTEFEQFKNEVEPTLAALPASYRAVLQKHHDGVVAQLRDHLDRAHGGPVELDDEPFTFDVVFSIDAPADEPGLVMLVLPITEEVSAQWATRPDDLQSWVGARAVQALYVAFKAVGDDAVVAICGGHQGLVAIEAELEVADVEALSAAVSASIAEVFDNAPELVAARVQARATYVEVDHLLPPEEGDDAHD